jgi:hypothetical protein
MDKYVLVLSCDYISAAGLQKAYSIPKDVKCILLTDGYNSEDKLNGYDEGMLIKLHPQFDCKQYKIIGEAIKRLYEEDKLRKI